MGACVVAIIEIAIDDFKKSAKEAQTAEDVAAERFKDLQSETQVRIAVFNKDVEWKTRTKVKLEFDQSQMNNDLKSYEETLAAINTYMKHLQGACTVKGISYEE